MNNSEQTLLDVEVLKNLSTHSWKKIRKDLLAKILKKINEPEEKVRYWWIQKLINEYGYDSNQIEINIPAGVGRSDSNVFADIVVYRDNERTEPFIVGEVKAEGKRDNIDGEQSGGYARNIGAEYHFWSNKTESKFWKTSLFKHKQILIGNIPLWIGKKPVIKKISNKEILPPFRDVQEFRQVVSLLHDLIYREGHDPAYAFDELTKLLFLKLYDERETPYYYEFMARANETQQQTVKRIERLFQKALRDPKYHDVFLTRYNKVKKLALDLMPQTIYAIVQQLQGYSLVNTTETIKGADIKGEAYEQMVGGTFRGELGQYFTPREMVDFMVKMLNPDKNDKILDPACGSGGFLIMCIKHVNDRIREENPNLDEAEIKAQIKTFCEHNVYGLDINPRMSRVAKMNMIMHGDGHSGIFNLNGLLVEKDVPKRVEDEIIDDTFSMIFSNPPFAGYENSSEILKKSELGKNKEGKVRSITPEILFIEKIIKLLKYGGKCALVLPLGIFTNPSDVYKEIREYIKKHTKILAMIGLPTWVFQYTDTGVNGALLFLEKVKNVPENYKIFCGWAENVGYTSTGRKSPNNDFDKIYDNYKKMKEENVYDVSNIKDISSFLQLKEDLPFFTRILKFSENKKDSDDFCLLKDRIDPEYYHPKYEVLLHKLKQSRFELKPLIETIELKKSIKDVFKKKPEEKFYYLENNDVDMENHRVISEHTFIGKKAPSRAKYSLQEGDFLIPNAKESIKGITIVPKEYDGYIGTSRFYVAKPLINKDYLFAILNSKLILNLLRRESSGEIALTISNKVFDNFLIPVSKGNELEDIVKKLVQMENRVLDSESKVDKAKEEKEEGIANLLLK